jgi:formamidopyrimidine-DNA glycosylase
MPELPDVEVMRRYLQSTSLHQKISDVDIRAEIVIPEGGSQEDSVMHHKEELERRSFESTRRHGKWLFAALEGTGEKTMVFHFGMTGGLKYFKDMKDEPEYTQVLFRFANGYHLAYFSQRKLGELEVIESVDQFIKHKDLGPDALEFRTDTFTKLVEGRHAMIKTTLMDQSKIAGIGNVYSDEVLFQAEIYPRASCDQLNEDQIEDLYLTMKDVLKTAIDHDAEPEPFPDDYITPYRHKGGHCPICGEELQRMQVGSRYAYYCPNRQEKSGS